MFRGLYELSGWLGDIDYENGIYYLTQWEGVYRFAEEEDPTEFFHLAGGRILSIAVVKRYAYAAARMEGRIYKIDISTGQAETFVRGLNEPTEIEFVPVALVGP